MTTPAPAAPVRLSTYRGWQKEADEDARRSGR